MKTLTYQNSRGQSLFEVVIALAISALIIVSLVSLVSSSIRNTTFSKNKTLAARYAQEGTEWLRGQRDEDIATFKTNTLTPIWCFKDLSFSIVGPCGTGDEIDGTPFKREIVFSSTSVNVGGVNKIVIQADVSVVWEDSQGFHEVKSATNFVDWRER